MKKFMMIGLVFFLSITAPLKTFADEANPLVMGQDYYGDGRHTGDGWYWQNEFDSGSYVCVYYKDGRALKNETTPDGFHTNISGEWYTTFPGLSVTRVVGYHCLDQRPEVAEKYYTPFSCDGNVVNNDFLGIRISVPDSELENDSNPYLSNWDGAQTFKIISINYGGQMLYSVSPHCAYTLISYCHENRATQEYVNDRIALINEILSDVAIEPYEMTIAGRKFIGTKEVSQHGSGTHYNYDLYTPLSVGGSLRYSNSISVTPETETEEYLYNYSFEWFNNYLEFTK